MKKKNLFDCTTYKSYIINALGGNQARTGLRKQAAEHMGCQSTYLSKVLNEGAHLSLEQAYLMNEFLAHDSEESDFFFLLVQKGRAGSKKLSDYFEEKIQSHLERRKNIRNRIEVQDSLSTEDQAIYYSKWYYSCIHVMVSIPELRTKSALVEYLKLPANIISDALAFLETRGLLICEGDKYKIGPRHLHLPQESPYINKHHANWRLHALQAMDVPKKNDLHYSVVVTLSHDDVEKIRARIMDLIQENMKTIRDSKEECTLAMCFDFFQI